jgi:hypothetical protein
MGNILPAGRLLLQTGGVVLSGCSRESLDAVLKTYPLLADSKRITICCEFNVTDKVQWLNRQPVPGYYFDDWHVARGRVREETKWIPVDALQL